MANKEAVFTVKVNTGNSVQDLQSADQAVQQLGKDLQQTQTVAKDSSGTETFAQRLAELDAKLEAGGLSMREMTQTMKEYQTIALQAGAQSPVGQQAIQSASQLKDEIGDLKNATTALSSDTVKLDTALAGISVGAQAFSGIQSAMALAGVENENLVKSMQKLQAVQGVVNSVSTIANALQKDAILGIQLRNALQKIQNFIMGSTATVTSTTTTASTGLATAQGAVGVATGGATVAMRVFKTALIATGIGAIVVLVGTLIEALSSLGNEAELEAEKIDLMSASIERLGSIQQFETDISETLGERMVLQAKLRGASDTELLRIEKDNATARINMRNQQLNEIIAQNAKIVNNEFATAEQVKKAQDAIAGAQNEQRLQQYKTDNLRIQFKIQEQEIEKKQQEEAERRAEKARQNAEKQRQKAEQNRQKKKQKDEQEKQEQLRLRDELLKGIQASIDKEMKLREELEDLKISMMNEGAERSKLQLQEEFGDWRENLIRESAKKEIQELDAKFKTGKMKEEEYRAELEKIILNASNNLSESEKQLLIAKELELQNGILKITDEAQKQELEKRAEKEQHELDLIEEFRRLTNDVYQNELMDFEKTQKEQIKALNEAHQQKLITDEQYLKGQETLEKQYNEKIVEINKKKNEAIEEANKKTREESLKSITDFLAKSQMVLDHVKTVDALFDEIDQARLNKLAKSRDEDLQNLDAKMQAELNAEGVTAEQKKQIEEKFAQQKYQVQLQAYNAEEKIKKAQFNRDKAIKLSQIAIDTASAIVKAIAQYGPPPSPMGIAGIASAGIIGITQALAVANQQYKSGSAPSPPSLSGGGGGSMAGASASSFTSTATPTSTAGLTEQGTPTPTTTSTQVYVLESDISATQNKVKLQDAKTSF